MFLGHVVRFTKIVYSSVAILSVGMRVGETVKQNAWDHQLVTAILAKIVVPLGPLTINPIYTFFSGKLLGVFPFSGLFGGLNSLKLTFSHLKMDGWKWEDYFPFGTIYLHGAILVSANVCTICVYIFIFTLKMQNSFLGKGSTPVGILLSGYDLEPRKLLLDQEWIQECGLDS